MLESKLKLTDDIIIDLDYIPVDIVVKFLEIYHSKIDEDSLSNPVITSIKLTRAMDKSDILDDVIMWAKPKADIGKIKKQTKTNARFNLYLNLIARIEDYLIIDNAQS